MIVWDNRQICWWSLKIRKKSVCFTNLSDIITKQVSCLRIYWTRLRQRFSVVGKSCLLRLGIIDVGLVTLILCWICTSDQLYDPITFLTATIFGSPKGGCSKLFDSKVQSTNSVQCHQTYFCHSYLWCAWKFIYFSADLYCNWWRSTEEHITLILKGANSGENGATLVRHCIPNILASVSWRLLADYWNGTLFAFQKICRFSRCYFHWCHASGMFFEMGKHCLKKKKLMSRTSNLRLSPRPQHILDFTFCNDFSKVKQFSKNWHHYFSVPTKVCQM